jgi:hypothetical protein
MLNQVLLCVLNINTSFLVDCSISLNNGSDLTSILFDELGCPVTYITESLNDVSLVLDAL